jgi:hypothetical protein
MPRTLIALLLAGTALLPGQDPTAIPLGFILVDDMWLPEEVVLGESSFTATSWPYGVVAYEFNANVGSVNQVLAQQAMAEISAVCGVIFVPRTTHQNWIHINASTVNNSFVGMQGGGQVINITSWGTKFTIVHELMHALGYIHEHCRPDRDNFVSVNWNNIQAGQSNNFVHSWGSAMPTGYDFLSIMHYSRAAFSSNGQDTITCLPAYSTFQTQIGNRSFMSLTDAQGLQARYGSPLTSPSLASISPTQVTTSSGSFTLNVYGSNFHEGTLTGAGVSGTKIRWNGAVIPTTFVNSGHIRATVTPSMISQPQNVTISVVNPSPGTNIPNGNAALNVVCQSGTLGLANGTPTTTTNGCQQFSVSPSYGVFNVVAVSSPSDWDIQMGSASALAGGNTCDFLAGSGYFGAGTISPVTGNVTLYSGSSPGTLQHVTSTQVLNGQPTIASMSAGSIVRAFHFYSGAVSTRMIQVAGPTNLRWKLLWEGNSFSWRSSTTNVVAQGTVGTGPVTGIGVVSGNYCLVIYNNGGPIATSAPLTITMCFDFTPASLVSSNFITTTVQGPYSCVPFSITPLSNQWNVVGVSAPSDWDIQMGGAVSQNGGSNCDYVLANGRLGAVSPVTGVTSPYSIPGSNGSLQFAPTATMPTAPSNWYSYTYMLLAFEVYIPTAGNYDFSVSSTGYNWDLHAPGTSSAWRSASQRMAGSYAANGQAVTITNLQVGWHCVVVYRNGGASGTLASPGISVVQSVVGPPPTLSLISPDTLPSGSGPTQLVATGGNFASSSTVRLNGSSIPTQFQGSTSLVATIPAPLLASPTTYSVDVLTPGQGTSPSLVLTVGNPVPVLAGISPASHLAGSPSFALSLTGSSFVPGAEVRWNGIPIGASFVSSTQLQAYVDASLLLVAGPAAIQVENPRPAGGLSGIAYFAVIGPTISSLTPPGSPILAPGAPPIPVTVQGVNFAPWTVVHANGVLLPTTYVNASTLQISLDPTLFVQSTRPGALGLTASSSAEAVSNLVPFRFGTGSNQGLIRSHPLGPLASTPFALWVEGSQPGAPLTVVADAGGPVPIAGWPNAAVGLVLGVTPIAGSPGPYAALLDGMGIFGPADGTALGPTARFSLPGLVMPSPPLGVAITLQAAHADPAAALGFHLTWALHTFDL